MVNVCIQRGSGAYAKGMRNALAPNRENVKPVTKLRIPTNRNLFPQFFLFVFLCVLVQAWESECCGVGGSLD